MEEYIETKESTVTEMIDISNDMNDAFYKSKDIKKGSVLMFKSKDEKTGEVKDTNLKIVRLNRKKKICIVDEIRLYTPDNLPEGLSLEEATDGSA